MGRWDIYKNTFNDFRPSPQRERARDKKRNPKKKVLQNEQGRKSVLNLLKSTAPPIRRNGRVPRASKLTARNLKCN